MLSFPISLPRKWYSGSFEAPELRMISRYLRSWLLEEGSLTARLKTTCEEFFVEVLSESCQPVPDELSRLVHDDEIQMWCREVLLWCDNQPVVYAQSWIPESLQAMTKLGTTPLGEVLFQTPKWSRGEVEITLIDEPLYELLDKLKLKHETKCARRSLFTQGEFSMLVCEAFLLEPKIT
ncbi:chorismate lyase [Pseudoalteromonas xiamenensis]|uniref:chorismate--pyruvate lyase family protein n=1 Tax=Pseudoalteromonas xiamenensis TaxID=882626 RepID=UPI0027E4A132|nr:chorismate lyase [Pseudoalteromonas xiamenensis]WMN59110.1 chorismate lyase [Pseudoalteromonas xiamenensis]